MMTRQGFDRGSSPARGGWRAAQASHRAVHRASCSSYHPGFCLRTLHTETHLGTRLERAARHGAATRSSQPHTHIRMPATCTGKASLSVNMADNALGGALQVGARCMQLWHQLEMVASAELRLAGGVHGLPNGRLECVVPGQDDWKGLAGRARGWLDGRFTGAREPPCRTPAVAHAGRSDCLTSVVARIPGLIIKPGSRDAGHNETSCLCEPPLWP